MKFKLCGLLAAWVANVTVVQPVRAELSAEQVHDAINRGAEWLTGRQNKANGNWSPYPGYRGGMTSLCTLALLHAGVDVKDASIQKALDYLASIGNPELTYCTSLQTMVFCKADPELKRFRKQVTDNVSWLERVQIKAGHRSGMWGYSGMRGNGDNSNTQFALLALHEAHRLGIRVQEQTWQLALDHWVNSQNPDGSWGYFEGQAPTGSMTCAGIASLIIAMEKLPRYSGDATVEGDKVICCGEQRDIAAIENGLRWLSQRRFIAENPGAPPGLAQMHLFYYYYAIERVGRLSGRRFIGTADWYRQIAEKLVAEQDPLTGSWRGVIRPEDDRHIATSFALLFLSKGKRPVLIAKYKHSTDSDWDLHRKGVQNLTHSVEKLWNRDLTWQTVEGRAATVDDLLQSPVLFISGRKSLELAAEQKQVLQEYVNQGGFIFAEACCDGAGFDQQFRQLMKELFPNSELRLLAADHPVWYAEGRVDPKYMRPLYGVDACCRTSVVYCPENLSCYWELARDIADSKYPAVVREEIDACVKIGQNVLAYATNRVVEDKLARPQVSVSDTRIQRTRDMLFIPKLSHSGGSDDAPNAWPNLLSELGRQIQIRVSTEKRLISPDDPALYDYPILFMHGRRSFHFSATQRKSLATYLERGGFVFADSICTSEEFTGAFRKEFNSLIPGNQLKPIRADHPMLTQQFGGADIRVVSLRTREARAADDPLRAKIKRMPPQLEVLEINGRLAVVFSPYDISCAMENTSSLDCESYEKSDAARIGINVILYALQQ